MDFMAGVSRRKFRGLVYEDPAFPSFFREITPLDVIERLNIGSRPASRRSGEGIENLRPETKVAVEAFLMKQASPTK